MLPDRRSEQSINTTGDLLRKLRSRADTRQSISAALDVYMDRLVAIGHEVSADEMRDIEIASLLLTEATRQANTVGVSFARDLIVVLLSEDKETKMKDLSKKYDGVQINGMVTGQIVDSFDIRPGLLEVGKGGMLGDGLSSGVEIQHAEISRPAAVDVGGKNSSIEGANTDILNHLSERYPSIATLFSTNELWVDGNDGHEYTQLKNIMVLITNRDWDQDSMARATAAFRQTILKAWAKDAKSQKDGKGEYPKKFPGYHGNHFISKELAEDLILFLGRFLRMSSYSENSLTTDLITKWPATVDIQDRKKK